MVRTFLMVVCNCGSSSDGIHYERVFHGTCGQASTVSVDDERWGSEMGEPVKEVEHRRARALAAAEACAKMLTERFGVRRVIPFGSLIGQGPWHGRSDADLAVEGLPPEDYIPALTACWELFPSDVELDLVPLEQAPPELKARILGESPVPTNPLEALKQEIQIESHQVRRVVDSLEVFLSHLSGVPDEYQILSIGGLLHNFYSGVERIFERIAARLDADVPGGSNWHTDLLRRMEHPWGAARPGVIDHALATRLMDYLRFRHLFRHSYGFELEWERCRGLAEGIGQTMTRLQEQLQAFLARLPEWPSEG
jgi:predicted nucleotidyltransferase